MAAGLQAKTMLQGRTMRSRFALSGQSMALFAYGGTQQAKTLP